MRWTDRLIGLVSTMILARLLVPEDFGIVAMASMVIGLVDVLMDMGVDVSLVQNRSATQDDFNAAWTLRLVQAGLAAVVVVLAAYPASEYFHDARVAPVVQVLALSMLVSGFENIGVVNFQKRMEFGLEFRYLFLKRFSGFMITIVSAFVLRSYWALVIGSLGGRVIGVMLSYLLNPMRPRLSLARAKPILCFSSWNLVRGVGGYANENLHRFVVGHRTSSSVMGAYTLGSDIAAIPSTELISPLSRVLFPVFVNAKDDPKKLKETYVLALGVQTFIGMPAGAGLAMVAEELVLTLLGEKWRLVIPFIQIMGAINIVSAIGNSGGYLLLALGRAKVTAVAIWLQILLFGCLVVTVIPDGGAMEVAWLRLVVAVCGLSVYFVVIRGELATLQMSEILQAIWRPLLASALMAGVLLGVDRIDVGAGIGVQLLFKVIIGAVTYGAVALALWRLAGCPAGSEPYLLEKLKLDGTVGRWARGERKLPG